MSSVINQAEIVSSKLPWQGMYETNARKKIVNGETGNCINSAVDIQNHPFQSGFSINSVA
jgi:hypothetical protein